MSRFPGASWRPVTRYDVGGANHIPMAFPRRVVLHTAVSSTSSLFSLFNTPGNPVAHFYVDQAGHVEQYVDSNVRASAVLDGNHDCLTIETWDGYTGKPGWQPPPWNDAQLDALTKLVAWCCKAHSIPAQRLVSSRPGTQGIGWHRQGIDGNFPAGLLAGRISGGEVWSSSTGKTCPGDNRIEQIPTQVIPRVRAALAGTPAPDESTTTGDESEMQLSDDLTTKDDTNDQTVGGALRRINAIEVKLDRVLELLREQRRGA